MKPATPCATIWARCKPLFWIFIVLLCVVEIGRADTRVTSASAIYHAGPSVHSTTISAPHSAPSRHGHNSHAQAILEKEECAEEESKGDAEGLSSKDDLASKRQKVRPACTPLQIPSSAPLYCIIEVYRL